MSYFLFRLSSFTCSSPTFYTNLNSIRVIVWS
uniref:Uncharacterized protein n=1 Tax=virus sp. ctML55 TaxID=2827627 RepID=A0A8S5RIH0_9VIRU|nr:MAG TPA: hypothetical protein [virus sp. ctML55]